MTAVSTVASDRRACRRLMLTAVLLCLASIRVEAQVAVGDSLWQLGRTDEAAQAYRRALAQDRNSVRANFRVAQTLAWNNNIDSALTLIRAARERVPTDPDFLLTEALYLSWAKRFGESILRYDSVIAAHPGPEMLRARVARARVLSWAGRLREARAGYDAALRLRPDDRDARFGRAQVASWSGDLESASAMLETLLAENPADVGALIALASTRSWQGRLRRAEQLAERAAQRDSANPDVLALLESLRSQRIAKVDAASAWSEDSEGNLNTWQTLGWRRVIGDGIRLGGNTGFLSATDPIRRASRVLAEASIGFPMPRGSINASVGLRAITPSLRPGESTAMSRQVVTGRLGLQLRAAPWLSLNAGAARWPFDEVAIVTPLALDITQSDFSAELRPRAGVSVVGSTGQFDYSDGNRRANWGLRSTLRLSPTLSIGGFVTGFGFERPDRPSQRNGYFSPGRFRSAEGTLTWGQEGPRWSSGLSAGYGTQQIDSSAVQSQWHADARIARRIGAHWQLEAFAGKSTSAAASAVGAYAYSTASLTLRRAF